MTNFKPEETAAIAAFVRAFQGTTTLLKEAAELRYTPAPRSHAAKGTGPDPTAEAVLEPNRLALDRSIYTTALVLQDLANRLRANTADLEEALDAYRS